MSSRLLSTILSLLLFVSGDSAAKQDLDTWILVDTRKMVLSVLEGDKVRRTYNDIAIGRAGTAADKKQGDNKTPPIATAIKLPPSNLKAERAR